MKISVIIPAYNAVRWLPDTLRSVVSQEGPEKQVIVVDDGSTDDTAAMVARDWPDVHLIRTENKGVSHARNTGAAAATGDLIQFLDADDLLLPGKLERQARMLADNEEADAVYSNWQRLNQAKDGTFAPGEKVERTFADIDEDPQVAFFLDMWCPTGAYLYRRSFLSGVGEWNASLPVIQDVRFAIDCTRAGARWLHDPHISVLYRQHRAGSVSTRSRLAFQKDVWTNTRDMEQLWAAEGTLEGARREAIMHSYRSLARTFFELERPSFETVYARLLELDPSFRPAGARLAALASLVGYRNAEQMALWYRRAKGALLGSHS